MEWEWMSSQASVLWEEVLGRGRETQGQGASRGARNWGNHRGPEVLPEEQAHKAEIMVPEHGKVAGCGLELEAEGHPKGAEK